MRSCRSHSGKMRNDTAGREMAEQKVRIERDSMGELKVPAEALWGAQTQRAVENFPISNLRMPRAFIRALGLIKQAAAEANQELGGLDAACAAAIGKAAGEVAQGRHDAQFPVDVFQTGSGTSSNMNANEVIAPPRQPSSGQAGASQRSGQYGPEQQRRHPHGDARECGAGAARRVAPGAASSRRHHRRQGQSRSRTSSRPGARISWTPCR